MIKKTLTGLAFLLLVLIIGFMAKDLFDTKKPRNKNVYEYPINKLRHVDSSLINYSIINSYDFDNHVLKGVCIDDKDQLIVLSNKGISIFSEALMLKTFFPHINQATCVHFSKRKQILIGEKNKLFFFSSEGKLLKNIHISDEKCLITSITSDEENLFIADAGNKIIHRYDYQGKYINSIGTKNKEMGIRGFVLPSAYFDIQINREGDIWAANPGFHAFELFSKEGSLKSSWERTSMQVDGFSGCCNPSHFALLSNGSFVTSEKGIERIKIHDQTGNFQSIVAPPNDFIEGTKGIDLAVNSKDEIYLIDPVKSKINRYKKNEKE